MLRLAPKHFGDLGHSQAYRALGTRFRLATDVWARRPTASREVSRTLESVISAPFPETRPEPVRKALRKGKQLIEGTQELAHDAASSARNEVHRAGAELRSRASDLKHRAMRQIEHARDVASERASQLKHSAGNKLDRAKQTTTHLAETQPLVLVALSLEAGAGTAMLPPSTKPGKQLLGPTRDRFVDEASDTAARVGGIARETSRDLRDNFRH